jgi:hypothetical protein
MGSSNLWYAIRQLATADFLRELTAAWLVTGAVFAALFLA